MDNIENKWKRNHNGQWTNNIKQ